MKALLVWADGKVKFTESPACAFHNVTNHDRGRIVSREYFRCADIARAGLEEGVVVFLQVPESVYLDHCAAIERECSTSAKP